MKMNAAPIQNNTNGPFADVDEVSDKIFNKVIPFPLNNGPEPLIEDPKPHLHEMPQPDEQPASRLHGFTKLLLNSMSKFAGTEDPHSADELEWPADRVLVVDEEGRLLASGAIPRAWRTENSPKKKSRGGLANYLALPDDVRMLESEPSANDEEDTLAAIRKVMAEQKRETSR